MEFDYPKICSQFLEAVSEREKEIIERRFGFFNRTPETLQKIGEDFDLTRERVRQIEREGMKKIREEADKKVLGKIYGFFKETLSQYGGIKREDLLLDILGRGQYNNYVYFVLVLGEEFYRFSSTKDFYPFWSLDEEAGKKVSVVVRKIVDFLKKKNRLVSEKELRALKEEDDERFFYSCLEVARFVEKSPLGHYGLVEWPEVKPRGVRDKAYLVLKKEGKPLHFTKIAEIASSLKSDFFENKTVLPQTVHNELIKDPRFVLVGRGTYALKEWGYTEGTVKEIILDILRKSKRPLSRDEILQEVLKQRLVRENTVLLNLADKNYFIRTDEGHYTIREA